MSTGTILVELAVERERQKAKHGDQTHLPDGTGPRLAAPSYGLCYRDEYAEAMKRRTKARSQNEGGDGSVTFEHILTEEWAEAIAESDPAALRVELIQVAAVAVQWIEALDLRAALAPVPAEEADGCPDCRNAEPAKPCRCVTDWEDGR